MIQNLIQKAKQESRPVQFTVESHPEDLFDGTIEQIRVIGAAEQTVVTYTVVIGASNAALKLLPGMTATVTFEVDSNQDVIKIPSRALRFVPLDPRHVREQDRKLVDSSMWKQGMFAGDESSDDDESVDQELTAAEKTKAYQDSDKRHVWVVDGDFLKAIEIRTGLSDVKHSELVFGDLKVGDKLVTRQSTK